jgi:hypothetical protein
MIDLARIFSADGFMPHGVCYLWRPALPAIHVGSLAPPKRESDICLTIPKIVVTGNL